MANKESPAVDWKSFLAYIRLVRTHMLQEFNWPRDMLIATAIAGSTAWLQIHYRLVDPTQSKAFWLTVLAPYAVVLWIHLAIRAIVAPYRLHRAKEKQLLEMTAERDRQTTKLQEIENAKPRIVLCDP
jgi:hypothetical protein